MRVSSTVAAVVVAVMVAAQGATGLTQAALAIPQAIAVKGGIITLAIMLTLLKKVKNKRRGGRRHPLLKPRNKPHALHRLHRRAAATTTPDKGIFMRKASWEESEVEEAMEEAMRELVKQMDEDGCLQNFLCHLQESFHDTSTPEEDISDGPFPAEAPGCSQLFPTCLLQAAQLTEAFIHMGPLYNAV
ncbi:uncharacterized protein LOC127005307 [Eriocheir sinensis]|uniref:uncharacterized protein LOC127005307 n=1 Tax=Eriocheir sinensis TaxID=95602 RepID=UPI0021C6B685|nr:uncharacterized protein LOC127005307 [Eriocheir sinensis]